MDPEFSPLPQVSISEILGLVEHLRANGGREDIHKIASELKMEFGHILTVIRAAELLALVHTPGGDVTIEPLGEKLSRSKIHGRKTIVKEQLEKLPVFQRLAMFLKEKENQEANRDELLEKLADLIPNENCEQTFSTLVNWARYAEIFGYNNDTEMFYLDTAAQKV